MLPNELIIEIYSLVENKYNMLIAFPFLKFIKENKQICCKNNSISRYLAKIEYNNCCKSNCKINYIIEENFICDLNCENYNNGIYFIKKLDSNEFIFNYLIKTDNCIECKKRIRYRVYTNYIKLT